MGLPALLFCLLKILMITVISSPMFAAVNAYSLSFSNASIQNIGNNQTFCSGGVFLSSQFELGMSPKAPTGSPPIVVEYEELFPCNVAGTKECKLRCAETLALYMRQAANIICVLAERDVFKERIHLFVKNCNDEWVKTKLGDPKPYCCKDGEPYRCPT